MRIWFAFMILALTPNVGVAEAYQLTDGTEIQPLDQFQECEMCPEMVALPMGSFTMGAKPGESIRRQKTVVREGKLFALTIPEGESFVFDYEGPQHVVDIDIPIAIGLNEVTWNNWMACVENGGCGDYVPDNRIFSHTHNGRVVPSTLENDRLQGETSPPYIYLSGSQPVIRVSLEDMQRYADWLNAKVGAKVYRLPTEAEWEYAARAGTQTRFAEGDQMTSARANFSGLQMIGPRSTVGRPDLLTRPAPVPAEDLDAANSWGVRHMASNVWEMTQSCVTERHVGWRTASEWLSESSHPGCNRVIKGGSF